MNFLQNNYKTAIITGASSGIGKSFAEKLAELGLNLVLIARRKEKLDEIKRTLNSKYDIEIDILPIDLTEEKAVEKISEFCNDKEIDLLINNAGFGYIGEFYEDNIENVDSMINLNCRIPVELSYKFGKLMADRKKGAIIFLGSVLAFYSTPYAAVYSATKAFNLYVSEALSVEMKKNNIKVLALNPGATKTEFQEVAGMKGGPYLRTPENVVETAIKALGKKNTVVDGLLNRIMVFSVRFFPRKVFNNIVGKVIKNMNRVK